jgi:hypothetical protein
MPAIFSATDIACFGSHASSPTSSFSFWPSKPPDALISATASSAPFLNCWPKLASEPVIGPTTATLISWAIAAPDSARPVPNARKYRRSGNVIIFSFEVLAASMHRYRSISPNGTATRGLPFRRVACVRHGRRRRGLDICDIGQKFERALPRAHAERLTDKAASIFRAFQLSKDD